MILHPRFDFKVPSRSTWNLGWVVESQVLADTRYMDITNSSRVQNHKPELTKPNYLAWDSRRSSRCVRNTHERTPQVTTVSQRSFMCHYMYLHEFMRCCFRADRVSNFHNILTYLPVPDSLASLAPKKLHVCLHVCLHGLTMKFWFAFFDWKMSGNLA